MRAAGCVLMVGLVCGSVAGPAAAQGQATGAASESRSAGESIGAAGSPFMGGVPAGLASGETLQIGLLDAVARALDNNLGALLAEQGIQRAQGSRWLALNSLLPTLHGHISEVRQQTNLKAFGFPPFPGVPTIVGPFNVFDARVSLSQSVFDLGAINAARAEAHTLNAARYSYKSARDLVVLVTAKLYLQAVAAESRVDSVRAQLDTARALYEQAVDLKRAGMVPAIDVLRAQVQLNGQRQRATSAANDFEKAKLQLAHVIGLPIGQAFALRDAVPYTPVPDLTLEEALARAYRTRPDYLAAVERVSAAEATRRAAGNARLPSVHFNADYGDIGPSLNDSHGTFAMAGIVNVPLFQGRDRGRLLQADADLRSRRAEAEDAKATVYYDVRAAYLDLQASEQLLQVAAEARDLAGQQLTQARDRFAAGVADNLELVQAQETVAMANDQYISTLYNYNISKAALARALGIAEDAMQQYLGGSR